MHMTIMIMSKSSMTRTPPEKNLLILFVRSTINYTCSNATEVAQWVSPSYSRPPLYAQWRQRQWIQLTGRYPSLFTEQYPLSAICTVQIRVASSGNLPSNLPYTRQPPSVYEATTLRMRVLSATYQYYYFDV